MLMRIKIKDFPEGQRKGKQRNLDTEFPSLRWILVTPGGPEQHSFKSWSQRSKLFTLPAGDEITGGCCPLEAA